MAANTPRLCRGLGGKSPVIILPEVDVETATEAAMQLMVDPRQPVEPLLATFVAGYHAPAAPTHPPQAKRDNDAPQDGAVLIAGRRTRGVVGGTMARRGTLRVEAGGVACG